LAFALFVCYEGWAFVNLINQWNYIKEVYGGDYQFGHKVGRKLLRWGFSSLQTNRDDPKGQMQLLLYAPNLVEVDYAEIIKRLKFYLPHYPANQIIRCDHLSRETIFSKTPILFFGEEAVENRFLIQYRPYTFDIDFRRNPMDGWEWTNLAACFDDEAINYDEVRSKFAQYVQAIKNESHSKSYIFGTGPSLEKALGMKWDDGYRIVCNTLVRDPELWGHLKPHFIVAGDAIYHFGFTSFAHAFRNDLIQRLKDSNTYFVYPAQFNAIAKNELVDISDKLIPVPIGWRRRLDGDLCRDFKLPNLGNVLGLLLLPLASTLSKEVYLWGFDGRAPDDRLFWSNSQKHSYPEYMSELEAAHPKFFDHYVPATDPNKYVKAVQGDALDGCMKGAERNGWHYVMMHPSWTPILQKRYHGVSENGV
jgi:hypothetical protein